MNRFGKKENVESGKMAEQFLTLMADLDRDSRNLMSEWDSALKNAGFIGGQAQDLPFHISLTTERDHDQRLCHGHAQQRPCLQLRRPAGRRMLSALHCL